MGLYLREFAAVWQGRGQTHQNLRSFSANTVVTPAATRRAMIPTDSDMPTSELVLTRQIQQIDGAIFHLH
jgi:hypothetical protein